MFTQTLKLVFSFLVHIIRRFAYGINRLFLGKRRCKDLNYSQFSSEFRNLIKENVCSVDQYVFQDKGTEFLFKLGLFNINGNIELKGKVEGLKNFKETRHTYYFKNSDICTMAEFEASELNIYYDGIARLPCIAPAFLLSAVLKNVKLLIEIKIYPLEGITLNLNDVVIDEFKIQASISGLYVISWMVSLIVNITLKVMSFPILCLLEFHTKCYLNKIFSKFYLTQNYTLEKVRKSNIVCTSAQIEPCFTAEIEIAREMSHKSKFGPTSYFYEFMTGLFEFNKEFNKIVLATVFKENFKDFLNNVSLHSETLRYIVSNSQSSESDSDTSLISSDFCGFNRAFDDSGIRRENEIFLSESSLNTESDSPTSNSETVSTSSDTSSENEIVHRPENDSYEDTDIHLDKSYKECELQSKNDSGEDNLQFEDSFNECRSLTEIDFSKTRVISKESRSDTAPDSSTSNDETFSTLSETSFENSIVLRRDNDSCNESISKRYNECGSQSENDSGEDSLQFEESDNKCKPQSENNSGEDSLQFEESDNKCKPQSENDSGEDSLQFEESDNKCKPQSENDSGKDSLQFEESDNKCKPQSENDSDEDN